MFSFPLLQLNPNHLEKVINKLQDKSYFRIQQTCHAVHDFIHTSRYISVHVDRSVYLRWDEKNSCSVIDHLSDKLQDSAIESIYGTCLSSVSLRGRDVDSLCDALTKNRITARKPKIHQYNWEFEEYVKVLNALKCRDVDLSSSHVLPYEALFESKYLKKVDIYVDGDEELAEMAPDILPKFEEVKFRIGNPDVCALDLLYIAMENLNPELMGNLKMFRLEAEWQRHLEIAQLQELLLDEFDVKITAIVYDKVKDKLSFTVDLPQSFPPTASLIIDIEKVYTIMAMFITYRS